MVESELRFYSAFYVAYGLLVLRTATRPHPDPTAVRGVAGALLLGALGRAGAWLSVGKPHRFQRGLLAVELVLPPLFVVEQARRRPARPEAES
jgi:hypothetical protein